MAGHPALLSAAAASVRPAAMYLPYRVAPGTIQMGLDSTLLAWCAGGPGRVVFRAYGWSRPTLSLGRAEPFPAGWDLEALAAAGIDVVRRPTGGDAVLHDGELAFAAAASLPGPAGSTPRMFAHRVADAVAAGIRRAGLDAARVEAGSQERGGPGGSTVASRGGQAAAPGARPCFARIEPGEVRAEGFKVAGIASRFTRGAAMSHGSIPLTARHRDIVSFRRDGAIWRKVLDGHARALPELLSREVSAEFLGREIGKAFEAALGVPLEPASFTALGLDATLDEAPAVS